MTQTTQIAEAKPQRPKRLIEIFSERYKVDPAKMMNTLKNTCFRQSDGKVVTDEQMMALLVVANQYKLNPFTKEIYAFPDKGGIVPIVGVDGWARLINENDDYDGMEFEYAEKNLTIDEHHKPCPEWIKCIIHRKSREHPTIVTEFLDEVYKPPFVQNKGKQGERILMGPHQTHTKRMLRHKAMIQCARLAMSFAGIYDADEGERMVDASEDFIEVESTVIEDEPQTGTEALKKKIKEKTKKASEIDQPEPKEEPPAVDPETGELIPNDLGDRFAGASETEVKPKEEDKK